MLKFSTYDHIYSKKRDIETNTQGKGGAGQGVRAWAAAGGGGTRLGTPRAEVAHPPWVSDFRADGACPPRTLHRLGPRARKPSQTQETEVVGVSKTVASALDDLNAKWEPTRAESSTQYVLSLAAILADLHCADIVKGTKLSIQTDINVFQDLAVALQQWELSEYSEELSGFYRSSFAGIKLVQQRLERYQKMDGLLYSVLTHLLDLYELKGHGYGRLLPQRHSILKSVPVLLFLLHCQNGKFLEKKGVARAVSLLKKNPVLPVVGDCWMSSLGLLSTIDEFEASRAQSQAPPVDRNDDERLRLCRADQAGLRLGPLRALQVRL